MEEDFSGGTGVRVFLSQEDNQKTQVLLSEF